MDKLNEIINKLVTHQQLAKQLYENNSDIKEIKEILYNQRGLQVSEKVINNWVQLETSVAAEELNFETDEYLENNLNYKNIQLINKIQSFISLKFKNITQENQHQYLNVLIIQALITNGMLSLENNIPKKSFYEIPKFDHETIDEFEDELINYKKLGFIKPFEKNLIQDLYIERGALVFLLRSQNITLQNIANKLLNNEGKKVSRQRIEQIEKKEIKRLKNFSSGSSTYLKILKTIENQISQSVQQNDGFLDIDFFKDNAEESMKPTEYLFNCLMNILIFSIKSELNFLGLENYRIKQYGKFGNNTNKYINFINPFAISINYISTEEINTFLSENIFFTEDELLKKFESKHKIKLLRMIGKIEFLEIPKEIKNITGEICISNNFPANAKHAIKSILSVHFQNVRKTNEFSSKSDYFTCIEGIHFKDFLQKAKQFLPETSLRGILANLERYDSHGFVLGAVYVGHSLLRTQINNIKNSDNVLNTMKKILDENIILEEDAWLYKLWDVSPNLNYKSFYTYLRTNKTVFKSVDDEDDEQRKLWKYHDNYSKEYTVLSSGYLLAHLKKELEDKFMTVDEIIDEARSQNLYLNELSVQTTLNSRNLTFFNKNNKYKYNPNSKEISLSDITDEDDELIIDYYLNIYGNKIKNVDYIIPTQREITKYINSKGILLNNGDLISKFRNISYTLEKLHYPNLLTSSSPYESKKITKLIKRKLG